MGQFGVAVSAMDVSAMKCKMCFPLECHQSAKVTLPSSGKRVSARVRLAIVPDLSNYQACPWEWEAHGKRPMGWDGTAHICISHETQK